MKKYIEKKIRKYVIATLDKPTMYLFRRNGQWIFTDNIECASKTLSVSIALTIAKCYRVDTNDFDIELVILPIDVTYEFIDEENYDE